MALFSQKLCDLCSFVSPISGNTLKLVVYGNAQQLNSNIRMALSVQKMEIFDKDFKQLFENNAAFNQLLY